MKSQMIMIKLLRQTEIAIIIIIQLIMQPKLRLSNSKQTYLNNLIQSSRLPGEIKHLGFFLYMKQF